MFRSDPVVGRRLAYLLLSALIVSMAVGAVVSYRRHGLFYLLLSAELNQTDRIDRIRQLLSSWGLAAPMAYVGLVCIEVLVFPIPGPLLYLPGAILFGPFLGGLLSLIGNVLGAGIAAALAERLAHLLLKQSSIRARLEGIGERLQSSAIGVIALLRVNPLTSSDVVSYAAGLCGIRVWQVMLGTLLGIAPLCWAQSYFANWLFDRIPAFGTICLVGGVIFVLALIWFLSRQTSRGWDHPQDPNPPQIPTDAPM